MFLCEPIQPKRLVDFGKWGVVEHVKYAIDIGEPICQEIQSLLGFVDYQLIIIKYLVNFIYFHMYVCVRVTMTRKCKNICKKLVVLFTVFFLIIIFMLKLGKFTFIKRVSCTSTRTEVHKTCSALPGPMFLHFVSNSPCPVIFMCRLWMFDTVQRFCYFKIEQPDILYALLDVKILL